MIIEFYDESWTVKSNDLNKTYHFAKSKQEAINYCEANKESYTLYINGEYKER